MSKKLKVYYEFDNESPPEEVEARLARAFKFLFGEYEKYLMKKRIQNGKGIAQSTDA